MIVDRIGWHEDQLIIKITISEKRRIANLWKKGKFALKYIPRPQHLLPSIRRQKHKSARAPRRARNCNYECDWLTELSDNKLFHNKLSDNNVTTKLVEKRTFLNQSQSRKLPRKHCCGNIVAKANVSQFSRAWDMCCRDKTLLLGNKKCFCLSQKNFATRTQILRPKHVSQFSHHENNAD